MNYPKALYMDMKTWITVLNEYEENKMKEEGWVDVDVVLAKLKGTPLPKVEEVVVEVKPKPIPGACDTARFAPEKEPVKHRGRPRRN